MAIGDGLLEFGIVSAEALGKAFLPVAAPLHSHEVIGRGQHEPDRKKYVVKDAHSAVADLSALCLRIRNEPAKEFFSDRMPRQGSSRIITEGAHDSLRAFSCSSPMDHYERSRALLPQRHV